MPKFKVECRYEQSEADDGEWDSKSEEDGGEDDGGKDGAGLAESLDVVQDTEADEPDFVEEVEAADADVAIQIVCDMDTADHLNIVKVSEWHEPSGNWVDIESPEYTDLFSDKG